MNTAARIALVLGSMGICGSISAEAQPHNSATPITVKINNNAARFGTNPVIRNGVLLVPLRGFLQAIGANVSYQSNTGNITINIHDATVKMKVGARYVDVNGERRTLPKPLPIIDGRTMIPLRSVAEKMGAAVDWNAAQRTAFITNLETDHSQPTPQQGIIAGEIKVHATANKSTFRAGETVVINVTATNTDDHPRKLTLPSGQTFDVTITPTGQDEPKWNWSHGKAFTMAIRYVELKPGEKLNFSTEWNQTDNNGKVMPRGKVDIHAVLTAIPQGIKANRLMLHLVE